MIVKLEGGSSDLHMVSLNDMRKLADSIQKISYNYEYQEYGTKTRNIYIKANKEGSFEILLGLLEPTSLVTVGQGLMGAFLYDLIHKMREYFNSEVKKETIKNLIDTTFSLALELVEAEYFDINFEKKKQTIEENTKLINAELANYQAMKQIASIIGNSADDYSMKPISIVFKSYQEENVEVLKINNSTKELLNKNELVSIDIENILISGVPDGLSRSSKSFYIEVDFIGKMKIRASDKQLAIVSDYFKGNKRIKVLIKPIVKMGELTERRDATLIKIIGE